MREINISPIGSNFVVEDNYNAYGIVVPKGFVSNGATLNPLFWFILTLSFFNPILLWLLPLFLFVLRTSFHPRHLTASVVHDYICEEMEEYELADTIFEQLMLESGETKWRVAVKVFGVRLWHKAAYRDDNRPRWWFKMILKMKGK